LESYEDQAFVLLRYKLNGQTHTDRAPLQVAWDADGQLGLRVYSVEAGPSEGRWRLRLGDEEVAVTGQVLSRSLPEKLNFEWLLSDPLIAQNLSAGLAGFPPQLDLLLSPQPLSGLLQQEPELALSPPREFNGRGCHVVHVKRDQATYTLFIDRESGLLRRLRLPDTHLPTEMLADDRLSDISLSIEFDGIRIDHPIAWNDYRVDVLPGDKLLSHFVPMPPPLETELLGKRLPGFQLNSPAGEEVYSTAGAARYTKATVLVWLADHPACRLAAFQLAEAERTIAGNSELSDQVQFVCLWAEATPPPGLSFDTLADAWRLPGRLALDRDAMGRDLFAVQEAPSLVVLDAQNRLQYRESRANPALSQLLPTLLERIVAGEDLASSLLREHRQLRQRHAAALRIAQSIDAVSGLDRKQKADPLAENQAEYADGPLTDYDPLLLELRQVERQEHARPVVAASVDSEQQTWLLHTGGLLTLTSAVSSDQSRGKSIESPWSPSVGSRLCVSPQSEFVALVTHPLPEHRGNGLVNGAGDATQIQVLDTRSGKNQTMHLGGGVPIDLQWLTLSGTVSPRLAVLTSDQRTLLLDPLNREQLSGDCPSPPLAILPGSFQDSTMDGWVVLADRSLQPLRLSAEYTHNSLQALGRPASHRSLSSNEIRQLDFWPAAGPWLSCSAHAPPGLADQVAEEEEASQQWTLARGWLARNEPAAFLLDSQLRVRWHTRLALQPKFSQPPRLSAAVDPNSGLPTWVMADASHIIYLMRADGLTDHFKISDNMLDVSLLARGARLLLQIVELEETRVYEIRWH
jgi:hypothetical protein